MRSSEIQNLIDKVEARFGPIQLYGSSEDEAHGTCFKLENIPATFSVLTLEGTLDPDLFDVQIEGIPPGDYCKRGKLRLDELLSVIERFRLPEKDWPE